MIPPAPPPAAALYAKAVSTMDQLAQPQYMTYRLQGTAAGLQVDLTVLNGQVWLNVHRGSAPSDWSIRHRTFDYHSEIINASDGKRYVTARSFFDPTWYGAYRALREGMLDAQDPAAPKTLLPPAPDSALKTIATITVIGPAIYNVADRGPARCTNGDAGEALHLWPRSGGGPRQLSDVVVDLQNDRFCTIRFSVPNGFGFSGYVEQYYADSAGYWVQTGGLMEGTLRAFGISLHHGTWRYHLTGIAFPEELPAGAFAAP